MAVRRLDRSGDHKGRPQGRPYIKKTEPRLQGSARFHPTVTSGLATPPYFAAVLSAAMSASLRSVMTPIMLSR